LAFATDAPLMEIQGIDAPGKTGPVQRVDAADILRRRGVDF